jgi:hypothetical protein
MIAVFAGVASASIEPAASTLPNKVHAAGLAGDSAPGGLTPTATATPTGTALTGLACGEERPPVKTLSDPDESQVSFSPVQTTVHALRQLPKPSSYPEAQCIGTVERTTYSIPVTLVSMKVEDDRDIHLVVADGVTGETKVVEFPDTACAGANVPVMAKSSPVPLGV